MSSPLSAVPIDPIFQVFYDFQADTRPEKVNLGIGLYRSEVGEPVVFKTVQEAFQAVNRENFEYTPIQGSGDFLSAAFETLFPGEKVTDWALQATCGGTQACRIYADFHKRRFPEASAFVGIPTWGNHMAVFSPFTLQTFDHLTLEGKLNREAYQQAIEQAPEGSLLVIQAGQTHNPTGIGWTDTDLDTFIPLLNERKVTLFIDTPYIGFGDGFETDLADLRRLASEVNSIAFGVSFSKSACLYEHRTGFLMVKSDQPEIVSSHLQQLMRESVSMAPGIGQEIMTNLLTNQKDAWLKELENARLSVESRKKALLDLLPDTFQSLRDTKGLFGLLPLDEEQIQQLQDEHAIYLTKEGRINFGGLQTDAIERIAEALIRVSA